jgi:hypothetical protein
LNDKYIQLLQDSKSRKFTPFEALLKVIAQIDCNARQHPAYHSAHIINEDSKIFRHSIEQNIATEPTAKFLLLLDRILVSTLNCIQKDPKNAEELGYIILVILRLFRVNLHEIVSSKRKIESVFEEGYSITLFCYIYIRLLYFIV